MNTVKYDNPVVRPEVTVTDVHAVQKLPTSVTSVLRSSSHYRTTAPKGAERPETGQSTSV